MDTSPFFEFARARHQIYLDRQAGRPAPWTEDPILSRYRFTNVFRELDATTVWFRDRVRDPMRSSPHALLATVVFRWFNRIATGEAIFCQEALGYGDELPGETAWDALLRLGDTGPMRAAILQYCGRGPYVTGAYIIKTPDGYDKLDGVLKCIDWFMEREFELNEKKFEIKDKWLGIAEYMMESPGRVSLEQAWAWLRQFPYLGDFMAYEIVTDLRWTALLDQAPDILTWANPGPGATRGLGRLVHGNPEQWNQHRDKSRLIEMMQTILFISEDRELWPGDWPSWEMRDVEHTLCEFDKYERARLGQGRPRGVYRHG